MSRRQALPSAHDVARLAGVSQAAVSRAFTPGASIAKSTREKVLVAARSLGYRPNLLARSLITGKSGIVGVVVGDARYPFFLAALDALSRRLSRAGMHMLVHTAGGRGPVDQHVEGLLEYRPDAVLLMGARISPKLAARCDQEQTAVVSFSRPARRVRGVTSVAGDNLRGGAAIAEHFLAQGYRRLAVIGGVAGMPTGLDREKGFNDHLKAHGLPEAERIAGDFGRQGAIEAMRALLSRKPWPDAVFCANDDMALAAIEVARYEFGLQIGPEIGIAGFDDIEQAAWPSFDLTTYSLPVDDLIEMTFEALSGGGELAGRGAIVGGTLKVRGSTRRNAVAPGAGKARSVAPAEA